MIYSVIDDRPQIVDVDPCIIEPGNGALVTITGLNFTADMEVRLIRGVDTFESVGTVTFIDSETATVQIPTQTDVTNLRIAAFHDGQTIEANEFRTGRIFVCDP